LVKTPYWIKELANEGFFESVGDRVCVKKAYSGRLGQLMI
jgi:hypothetical protein